MIFRAASLSTTGRAPAFAWGSRITPCSRWTYSRRSVRISPCRMRVSAASLAISRNGDGIGSSTRISSSGRSHRTRVSSSLKNAPPGKR
jgi:hypothetical protein